MKSYCSAESARWQPVWAGKARASFWLTDTCQGFVAWESHISLHISLLQWLHFFRFTGSAVPSDMRPPSGRPLRLVLHRRHRSWPWYFRACLHDRKASYRSCGYAWQSGPVSTYFNCKAQYFPVIAQFNMKSKDLKQKFMSPTMASIKIRKLILGRSLIAYLRSCKRLGTTGRTLQ